MNGSTFAVIVPCYGHDAFVRAAIESLWRQTFTDFEIIAVDDGSRDRTGAILDDLAEKSPRPMRVVHTENHGAHAALNTGAALATAPYLAFLNDDDLYAPDRLDSFARSIRACPGFVWGFSAVEPIDEHGALMPIDEVPDSGRRKAIELSRSPMSATRSLPVANAAVSSGNIVVRTSTFHELAGFRDLRFVHDWDLALRLLGIADPFMIERPLYSYRVHGANAGNVALKGKGNDAASLEYHQIYEQHIQRSTERRYRPLVAEVASDATRPMYGPDDARAVRVTLWAMAKLRKIPPAYAAVRAVARLLRRTRRAIGRRL